MSKPTIIMITHASGDGGIDRLNASLFDRVGISGRLTSYGRGVSKLSRELIAR